MIFDAGFGLWGLNFYPIDNDAYLLVGQKYLHGDELGLFRSKRS